MGSASKTVSASRDKVPALEPRYLDHTVRVHADQGLAIAAAGHDLLEMEPSESPTHRPESHDAQCINAKVFEEGHPL